MDELASPGVPSSFTQSSAAADYSQTESIMSGFDSVQTPPAQPAMNSFGAAPQNPYAQPQFTQNKIYKATDGVKTAFITVDSQLYDETVDYFMQHTDTKFICIERALDTTKKFNLKNKMQDKFFAF